MASVTIKNVSKSYGSTQVVHGIDLDIADGEFVVFVGPSGCGKSTLLRMIAGLEDITEGNVSIGETVVNEVAPSKRGVAMVFQTYALYPHMTVFNNMAFGLKQAKTPADEIQRRVSAAAEVLHITELLERTPRALSGGQRQRVAIGRAIVREPEVFLFDEPLSNLDAALRVQTRLEIARLHKLLGATMIYVTHDQIEAMTLADKIVVLKSGNIEQIGTPIALYKRPANTFVAQFIGSPKMNFFSVDDLAKNTHSRLAKTISVDEFVGIRPEHLRHCEPNEAIVDGKLELVEQLGEYALAHMTCQIGTDFIVKMAHPPNAEIGDTLSFDVQPEHVHRFNKSTGLRIDIDVEHDQ